MSSFVQPAAEIFSLHKPDAAAVMAHAAPDRRLLLTCSVGRVLICSGAHCTVLAAGESCVLPAKLKPDALYFPTNRFSGTLQYLTGGPGKKFAPDNRFAASQYRIARAAYASLNENLSRHISIETLADQLRISPTHLKNSFRLVYGDSLFAFVRTQKMLAAAEILAQAQNRRTILDIAGDFGYDNGSKFAKAFQHVMGMTPREYRNAPKNPPESIRLERRVLS